MNSTDKQEMTLFLVSPLEYHGNGWDLILKTSLMFQATQHFLFLSTVISFRINASPVGIIKWLGGTNNNIKLIILLL